MKVKLKPDTIRDEVFAFVNAIQGKPMDTLFDAILNARIASVDDNTTFSIDSLPTDVLEWLDETLKEEKDKLDSISDVLVKCEHCQKEQKFIIGLFNEKFVLQK